ncbi:MAG: redoxin domain-containing protein [Chitinophagaceae bacterium]|nr:redoxin domain-containing protein [Chitinophagaceae bacterium]MBK8952240.1 redoxin domain-containing protein [Chitinophagaceae bacterium]
MKKTVLFLICFSILLGAVCQTDSIQPPYKKVPIYPPVRLLNTDSATYYTKANLPKNKPVLLIVFNPDCDHCQHETEALMQNIDKFKNVHIVMASFVTLTAISAFREKYKLGGHKNIVLAQDTHYFLLSFYALRNLPYLAFYNKKKQLISTFEGPMPVEKVLEELKK